MERRVPRVLLAGGGSGSGKTTLACAVMGALEGRGVRVAAAKCGPDYIDPMFHRRVTGTACNLDPFFFPPDTLRWILGRQAEGRDAAVIEGVMGYYDGLGLTDGCSSFSVAAATGAPAVLVLDAKGAAASLLAVLEGFVRFRPDGNIRGVIFNRCSPGLYPALARAVSERFGDGVRPLGYLPVLPAEQVLESRHLGLVTAAEVEGLDRTLAALAQQAERSVDLDGLLALAGSAPPLRAVPPRLPGRREAVRIGVARDRAFCFYYEDSLGLLEEMGAELVPFSPLSDPALPEELHGLYLGGGYPELSAGALSDNRSMRASVKAALEAGLPCIAECGGFMYLTGRIGDFPMVGALPGDCADAGRLTRFGYVTLTAKRDGLLCRAGESIPAHEFHRWDCTCPGGDFSAKKPGGRGWDCAVATQRLYAGFAHFHFLAEPRFAEHFYDACLEVKHGA